MNYISRFYKIHMTFYGWSYIEGITNTICNYMNYSAFMSPACVVSSWIGDEGEIRVMVLWFRIYSWQLNMGHFCDEY